MKTKFRRFEFKYIISDDLAIELKKKISNFVKVDSNTFKKNFYIVSSLYYDDQFFTTYHDKIDGLLDRKKFRLRRYANNFKLTPTFLELKGRYNNEVYKKRTLLPANKDLMTSGNILTKKIIHHSNEDVLIQSFAKAFYLNKIKPSAFIEYTRSPFFGKFDNTFRMTFDNNLSVVNTKKLYNIDKQRKNFLHGKTILEVKFERNFPVWFHGIIAEYGLKRISVSKICKGLERLNLVENEE